MIEVMVAVAVLGLILASTSGMMRMAGQVWGGAAVDLSWQQEGLRAGEAVREDLERVLASPRFPGFTSPGLRRPRCEGGGDRLSVFVALPLAADGPLLSALQEVRYVPEGGRLLRQRFAQSAFPEEAKTVVEEVLRDVTEVRFEYQDAQTEWQAEWTGRSDPPRMIRYAIRRERAKPPLRQTVTGLVRLGA